VRLCVCLSVCLFVPHDISKTVAARITIRNTKIFRHGSWKSVYFGGQNVKGQGQEAQKLSVVRRNAELPLAAYVSLDWLSQLQFPATSGKNIAGVVLASYSFTTAVAYSPRHVSAACFREPRLLRSGRLWAELRRQQRRCHDNGPVWSDAARVVRAWGPRLRRLQVRRSTASRLAMFRQAVVQDTHSRRRTGSDAALPGRTQDIPGSQLHLCTRYTQGGPKKWTPCFHSCGANNT